MAASIAREYGVASWQALKKRIETRARDELSPVAQFKAAVERGDAHTLRHVLRQHVEARAVISEPLFAFGAPALNTAGDEPDVVDVLLEFGADPNRKSDWWAGGFHPLYGASPEVANLLLAAGAIPDACAAAHMNRLDLLERIIAEDPSRVHERGGDGQTPLHFARSRAVVDFLLDAVADIDARDVDHRSTAAECMPLEAADRFGHLETLAALRSVAPMDQRLVLACHQGNRDEARAIIRAHPDIIERLSNADRRALTDEAWGPNPAAVRLLLELGFDPSLPAVTGPTGGNALHCAAWEGSVECVTALVEHPSGRALINSRENTYGGTPLSWCCHGSRNCTRAEANHAEVARLLLAAGAEFDPALTECSDAMQAALDSLAAGSRP